MNLRRNVLIFHQAALGDFVLSWPLAMAMGRLYPQSRIMYVAPASKGKLAERAIRVESVDIETGWHALFGQSPTLPERCGKLLAGAHTVFSFVNRPGDGWEQNVRSIAPEAKLHTMSTRATPREGHVSQWLIDDLTSNPAAAEAVRQMIRSIADRGLGGLRPSGKLALLHPGSGSPTKNWPIACFIELASRLRQGGYDVQFIAGEAERESMDLSKLHPLRQPAEYVGLFDLLSQASLFIGNDTGPAHLAGAIGVPTVTLFGPTNPGVWQPLGPKVQTLRGTTMADLPVDAVEEAAINLTTSLASRS